MSNKKVFGLVSSLGVLTGFITKLVKAVIEKGGTDEDIHRLDTPAGEVLIDEIADIIVEHFIVPIDRSKQFNIAKFLDKTWTIEEQDERSLALTQVDLTKVHFRDCLKQGETKITGKERLKRFKEAGHTCLDAMVFQTLWENQCLIPKRWKKETRGLVTYIFFDGTVISSPDGERYMLCLFWFDGKWSWRSLGFVENRGSNNPSAVLTS